MRAQAHDAMPPGLHETPQDDAFSFRVWSAEAFSQSEPQAWIVKDVLPHAELAVIYGESGSGKSFFMLDMMVAIARGMAWQGRRVRQGRVVIVAAEGVGGFRKRLLAYALHHQFSLTELDLGIVAQSPDLLKNDDVYLGESIEASGGASVIVIDTLAASMPGGNENSSEDMGRVLRNCKRLHEHTGALVVLVHHAGKDAERGARGWSGLKAATDAEIQITRSMDRRIAKVSKLKDGQDGAEFAFNLRPIVLGNDAEGDVISSCVVNFDASLVESDKRKEPRGMWEKSVLRHAKAMLDKAESVPAKPVIERAIQEVPFDIEGKQRDRRSEYAWRALTKLGNDGYLIIKDNTIRLPHEPHKRQMRQAESLEIFPHEMPHENPFIRGSCGSCGNPDSDDFSPFD